MLRLKRPPLLYFFGCPKATSAKLRGFLSFRIQSRVKRILFYFISKLRRFTFDKRTYRYFYNSYGSTWANERAIEVPIIWREAKKYEAQRILEIGNVLSHYYPVHHDIVDKFEKAPGVTNVDVREYDTSKDYDLIVSISTIEHVAYDELTRKAQESIEFEPLEEPVRIALCVAIENLKSHLSQGGEIVITVPLGYNPALDRLLKEDKIFTTIRYLKRISNNNLWREAYDTEIQNVRYDDSYFAHANVLAVCVFKRIPK